MSCSGYRQDRAAGRGWLVRRIKQRLILYLELVKNGFKSYAIYRILIVLNMICGVSFFFIQTLIWRAIYAKNQVIEDVTFVNMLTYLIVTSVINNLVSSTAGDELTDLIEDGSIETRLLQPVSITAPLYFRNIGKNIFYTLSTLPPLVLFAAVYGFSPPAEPWMAFFLLAAVINGSLIIFFFRYLLGLISFWFIRNPFIEWYFITVESLFSGNVVPIWFYPAWLGTLSRFLPFRYFVFEPVSLYLGKTPVSEAGTILFMQLLWLGVFIGIERIVWSRAHRKLIVQGG
jgi:ABC-2 type transport system permease protein